MAFRTAQNTDATAAQVEAAADAGANLVTHIFNAQRGLAHREPGVPGAALADVRYRRGLIADLHHVAAEICTLIFRAAPGRVVLVTDAIAAAGMPPGDYVLSGIPVIVGEDGVPRNADGTIADARVGIGAVAPTALVLDAATGILVGTKLEAAVLDKLAEAASAVAKPIDDKRGTIDYRKKVVGVLAKRAALIAYERAGAR